ncbi:hypothetical protein KDA23_04240 [Candidatus Saccharibacteria bacterium]|nr:hypothetical protein [Candidatus Saccharibacteria bacterium]
MSSNYDHFSFERRGDGDAGGQQRLSPAQQSAAIAARFHQEELLVGSLLFLRYAAQRLGALGNKIFVEHEDRMTVYAGILTVGGDEYLQATLHLSDEKTPDHSCVVDAVASPYSFTSTVTEIQIGEDGRYPDNCVLPPSVANDENGLPVLIGNEFPPLPAKSNLIFTATELQMQREVCDKLTAMLLTLNPEDCSPLPS